MSVAHPFPPARARSPFRARRRPSSAETTASSPSTAPRRSAGVGPVGSGGSVGSVVPGTRTPAGLPRDLVMDESGKPRRSVLLAAIMIRRGRSVAEIAQATGLSPDVVTCLSRSI